MGIEHRGGGVYYYASRRVGRRVVREYGGAGYIATLSAQLDRCKREERKHAAWDRRFRLDQIRWRNARFRRWLARASAAVADVLRAAGWHQHNREWRKKRGAKMSALATVPTAEQARATWFAHDLAQVAGKLDADTAEKAAKGDATAAPAVAAFVDGNPAAALLWGDLGRRVLQRWVESYAGTCLTTRRAVLRVASDLRAGLAGPAPSFLDLLVAERVVVGWVFLHWCEAQYARRMDKMTWAEEPLQRKRVESAHRSLMAACRTLAKVRRSKLPDVLALVNVSPPAVPVGAGE